MVEEGITEVDGVGARGQRPGATKMQNKGKSWQRNQKKIKNPKQNFKHADATVGQESPDERIFWRTHKSTHFAHQQFQVHSCFVLLVAPHVVVHCIEKTTIAGAMA